MNTWTRFGLAAGLASALALFGTAQAQQDTTKEGPPGSGTGSGAPDGLGKGDTGRTGSSVSSGAATSDTGTKSGSMDTGSTAAGTPSSDHATGGGGASASASDTAAGAPSAGKKLDKGLQDRLEKLHAGNQAELQLAQMAEQNAQSPDVKQFAQKMQTDHTAMDQDLTQQAQTMGVSLEGKTFQKEQQSATKDMQKLQSKTGHDFDKAYMSRMVKDHEKDLKEVKSAAKDAQKKDPQLASTLQEAQTKIQSHLTEARQVEKSLGQKRQARRPSSSSSSTGSAEPSGESGSAMPPAQEPAKSTGTSGGPSGSQTGQTPSGTGSSAEHSTH